MSNSSRTSREIESRSRAGAGPPDRPAARGAVCGRALDCDLGGGRRRATPDSATGRCPGTRAVRPVRPRDAPPDCTRQPRGIAHARGAEQRLRHCASPDWPGAPRHPGERPDTRGRLDPGAHVQRPADSHDSARRAARQRSSDADRAAARRFRHLHLLAGDHERALAADDARHGAADGCRHRNRAIDRAPTRFPSRRPRRTGSCSSASKSPRPPRSAPLSRSATRSPTDRDRRRTTANNRWPNHLARRLVESSGAHGRRGRRHRRQLRAERRAVNQSGVNALARFDRDVIAQPGAASVIVLEGINDIGSGRDNPSPSAEASDCRAQAAHRARARSWDRDFLRRHADPVRRGGILHRGRRGKTAGGQRVDPDRRRV